MAGVEAPNLTPCRHWRTSRARLWVREGVRPPTGNWEDCLLEGERSLAQMARKADRVVGVGRGLARAVDFGSGDVGIWRINRHGGLLGNFLGGIYWSSTRLEAEVLLSDHLRRQGVATPEVLFALASRRGVFWRQHLVTREVDDAQTVFEARNDAMARRASAELLERLFDLGLWATDLHPGNLLWQKSTGVCWLVDLAGATLKGRPLNGEERVQRRKRYLRYFDKHAGTGTSHGMLDD
ncbi:MAG: hypothetical protein HOM34_07620 [Planctomycetes bacterium]|nr:hypothetical protein [Planctomycetota bacterium]